MALRLKENLLIEILAPTNNINKYSKGVLNLKTIIELETKEDFKFPEKILELFEKIIEKEKDFIVGIPLEIIERYFIQKRENLNSYINIQFKDSELNMKTNELFMELEEFYKELFLVGSLIASYYNLEVKINNSQQESDFV